MTRLCRCKDSVGVKDLWNKDFKSTADPGGVEHFLGLILVSRITDIQRSKDMRNIFSRMSVPQIKKKRLPNLGSLFFLFRS